MKRRIKIADEDNSLGFTTDTEFGRSITTGVLGGSDVLIVGADGYESWTGSVWVLWINHAADVAGTVRSIQEISSSEGGFPIQSTTGCSNSCQYARDNDCDDGGSGSSYEYCSIGTDCADCGVRSISSTSALPESCAFGSGVSMLGDVDGDQVMDLAVGAAADDDGGNNRGALWVLLLTAAGTIKTYQKISDTSGSFSGTLINDDYWGASVAALGDLDGDGVTDLAVGAFGGNAVWVLFLQSDGQVNAHQKIATYEGGFIGYVPSFLPSFIFLRLPSSSFLPSSTFTFLPLFLCTFVPLFLPSFLP